MKTTYYKSHGSNQAESQTETNPTTGLCYTIHTYRNSRGVIQCEATECQDMGNGMHQYDLMGAKRVRLAEAAGKATESKIREVHEAGLKKWEELQAAKAQEPAPYQIEIGQVFFTDGLEKAHRRAVYEIEGPGRYKTVTLDGEQTKTDNHVRKYAAGQRIGTYYREGDKITAQEVNDLLNQATAAEEERRNKEREERTAQAAERSRKIAEGSKLLERIPAGVTHVIVGELHRNTSDAMTDYFGHETDQVIYLAWSNHSKDLFSEMRKAAEKAPATQHLGTGKGLFKTHQVRDGRYIDHGPDFTTEAEAIEYINTRNAEGQPDKWEYTSEEIEHREKYSMGSGYYLKDGHSNSSGWAVSKAGVPALEVLQIAAAEGRLFCDNEAPAVQEAAPVITGTVQIIDYSDKAIAVIGDTKPIKDKLKALGGKFNFRLSCGAGWIFPKVRLAAIEAALKPQPRTEDETIQDSPPEEINEPGARIEAEGQEEEDTKGQDGEEFSNKGKTFATYEEAEKAAGLANVAKQGNRATLLEAAKASPNIIFCRPEVKPVTPQVPAPWSEHGAKVAPQSAEAREIINEVNGIVKEAAAGKVSSAQAMEEAAAKIERIDTPKAQETAGTLRTMAIDQRAKLAAIQPVMTAHGETKQMYLF